MTTPPAADTFEFAALQAAERYRGALMEQFGSWLSGTVVEVGCGVGQMTALVAALPAVRRVIGIEPSAGFCRQWRSAFPAHHLIQGTSAALRADFAADAVLSVNVLEHIEDDCGELAAYRRMLAPRGGALCLFVPARAEIYAPLDRDFGHFRRYAKPGLRAKLLEAGFAIERLHYFNLIGYFAWWWSFRVQGRRRFDVAQVRLFDRWIFPAAYWLESRIGFPPIGQSLMAVARARSA